MPSSSPLPPSRRWTFKNSDAVLCHLVAEGTAEGAVDVHSQCAKRLDLWLELLQQFKPFQESSSSDSLSSLQLADGRKVEGLDLHDQSFLRRVCRSLNVEPARGWLYCELHFGLDFSKRLSTGSKVSTSLYSQASVDSILEIFFGERLASIRVLSHLFKSAISPAHWFQRHAASLIADVLAKQSDIMKNVVKALIRQSRAVIPAASLGTEQEFLHIRQAALELEELAGVLLWTSVHIDSSISDRVEVLGKVVDYISTPRGYSSQAFSRKDLFLISAIVNLLDIGSSGSVAASELWRNIQESSPTVVIELDKILSRGFQCNIGGLLQLVWSGVLAQFMDIMSAHENRHAYEQLAQHIDGDDGQAPLYVKYAQWGFNSLSVKSCCSFINGFLFLQLPSETRLIIHSSLLSGMMCFLSAFEISALSPDDCCVQILAECLQPDVLASMAVGAFTPFLQQLFSRYLELFPAKFDNFFALLPVVFNLPALAPELFLLLDRCKYYGQSAEVIDPKTVKQTAEKQFTVITPIPGASELLKFIDFTIESRTVGTYIDLPAGKAIVAWSMSWSFWDFIAAFISDIASRPRDLVDGSVLHAFLHRLLQCVSCIVAKFVGNIDLIDNRVAEKLYKVILPSILEGCAKLSSALDGQRLSSIIIVADLLDCLKHFAELYPSLSLNLLQSANILSRQSSYITRFHQAHELSSGKYPVTLAFLGLLDQLLLEARKFIYADLFSTSKEAEYFGLQIIAPFLEFFTSTILPGLISWKFHSVGNAYELRAKSMSILILLLCDFAPRLSTTAKSEPHKKSKLSQYGAMIKAVSDELIYNPSGLYAEIMIACLPSSQKSISDYSSSCQVSATVDSTLKVLQYLFTVRLMEPKREAVFEKRFISSGSQTSGFNLVERAFDNITVSISLDVCVRYSQICVQLSHLLFKSQPKSPSFVNTLSATSICSTMVRVLDSKSSAELKTNIVKFATSTLLSQPGLALELVLPKDGCELSAFVKQIIKQCSDLPTFVSNSPFLASALLEFLRIIWINPSYRVVAAKMREHPELWTAIVDVTKPLLTFGNDRMDLPSMINNVTMSKVMSVLACEVMLLKDGSKCSALISKALETANSNYTDVCKRISLSQLDPQLLSHFRDITQSSEVDFDAFRQVSWGLETYPETEYGRMFVFNALGLRSTQLEFIPQLELINLEFSLRDSQLLFLRAYYDFMSVSILKGSLTVQATDSQNLNVLLHVVFASPSHSLDEKRQFIVANYLENIVKSSSLPDTLIMELATKASVELAAWNINDMCRNLVDEKTGFYQAIALLLVQILKKSFSIQWNADLRACFGAIFNFSSSMLLFLLPRMKDNSSSLMKRWLVLIEVCLSRSDFREHLDSKSLSSCPIHAALIHFLTSQARSEYFLASPDTVITAMNVLIHISNSKICSMLCDAGIISMLETLGPALECTSASFDRSNICDTVLLAILIILSNLVTELGDSERVAYATILILDRLSSRLKLVFLSFQSDSLLNMMNIRLMEQMTQLHFLMCKNLSVWKRKYFSFADQYLFEYLTVSRLITDFLVHRNRFSELLEHLNNQMYASHSDKRHRLPSPPADATSSALYRPLQLQLLRILRNVYFSAYITTSGGDVFLYKSNEWQSCSVIFTPVLETSICKNGLATLGSLNVMLAFCRDRLESVLSKTGAVSIDKEAQTKVLVDLVQVVFLLFASQTVYALGSPRFDARQKSQISTETGGEIVAAIDSYNERMDVASAPDAVKALTALLRRLRKFTEQRIRRSHNYQ